MIKGEVQVLNLCDLNVMKVEDLLENCWDGAHIVMDDFTFCLLDISPFKINDYQTIIIQSNGRMYKSESSSNTLLENFAIDKGSIHEETCLVAAVLNYHQKIPYIIGERCVMPLDGYTKKPTTWLVLNQVVRATFDQANRHIHLITHQHFVLSIDMAKTQFEKQLHRAARILQFKLSLLQDRVKEYNHCYQVPSFAPPSIVADKLSKLAYERPPYTPFEADQKVRLYLEKKRVKEILGEGNPYYEDYLKRLEELSS